MPSEDVQQLLQQVRGATAHVRNSTYSDTLDAVQDMYTSTKEDINVLLRARNEEINQLQSEVDAAHAEALKLEREYNDIMESSRLYKNEASEQEQLYKREQEKQEALLAEVEALEKELAELTRTHDQVTDPSINQLRLAIYEGLGLRAHMDGEIVDKLILTSQKHDDMRTVSLEESTVYSTADYIWEFIS